MDSNQTRASSTDKTVNWEEIIRNNIHTFRDYLEKNISVKDLVGHADFFTREKRKELLLIYQTNPLLATKQALELLENNSRADKYTYILETLKKADYPKLVGLLLGNFVHTNDYHLKRLNQATPSIYLRLNPSDVIPHLLRKGVISNVDAAEIRKLESNKSRAEAALGLQYVLPNRHRHWYELTIRSLVESGQTELAEEIDFEVAKEIQASDRHDYSVRSSKISLQSTAATDQEACSSNSPELTIKGNHFQCNQQQKECDRDVFRCRQATSKVQTLQTTEIEFLRSKMKTLVHKLDILCQEGKKFGLVLRTLQTSFKNDIGAANDVLDKLLTDLEKSEGCRHVTTALKNDQSTPNISGCVFMPSGELMLCDSENNKAKLLDLSWKISDSVSLDDEPWDVSVFDNKTVIVTLPYSLQLQYLQVFARLKPDRTIDLDKACWGIRVFDNQLYVSCFSEPEAIDGEVRVLDCNGSILRSIGMHQSGSFMCCPAYLAINPITRRLYVSDSGVSDKSPPAPSTLYCLTLEGDVIYTSRNKDWLDVSGIFADDDDNVLVCSAFSNIVQHVIHDGTSHKTLLSEKDNITGPICLCVRQTDGTLVISNDNGCLSIYQLSDTRVFQY